MDPPTEANSALRDRIRQQEVVTGLSRRVLDTDDLERLLSDASGAVADTLNSEYAAVMELSPAGDEVAIRQGSGWQDGIVGTATVPTESGTQVGFTLRSGEPVVVDDFDTDERCSASDVLIDHDVVSGISVVIDADEEPWGALGAYTTSPRGFADGDVTFLTSVANVLAVAIDHAETERRLRERERRLETRDGNPVLAGIGPDVTERDERTRELAEYERIVETIDDGIYVVDDESRYTMVNDAFAEMTGYTREELLGEHASRIVDEAALERAAALRAQIATDETVRPTLETSIETADGDRVPVEVTFASLQTDDGQKRVGVVRDVTERTERERDLARFRRAVEASGHAIHMSNLDEEITYVNPAFEETTGYTAEKVIGESPRILESGEHDQAYYRNLRETIRAGEVWESEIVDRRKDGELYHAEQTIAPVTDEDGTIDRFVAVQNDVTERKERERALEESERRYRTLVENFPNGAVGLFDDDLQYTAVGGELLNEAGVDPDDRIGDTVSEVYPDELVEALEPNFYAALEGESNSFEVDYHDRHLYAHTLPVRNAADEVFAGMLVVQDVTERRKYQRRLEESNERLEQFAYAASHDLQEPLRMVSSYLQLIERRYGDALDEDGREFLTFAVDGADRMRSMIEGLLRYSRVETRGDAFEPVDLAAVLETVRETLRMKIADHDAELTVDPLPTVEGDREQLQQVFQNSLSNAIEYSGETPPRVHVAAERREAEWIVSVTDQGIGIERADQERIFDVFERLHGDEVNAGTGIGLALCERIVERHDGDIWVESTPGQGATFSVTLPAVEETPSESESE